MRKVDIFYDEMGIAYVTPRPGKRQVARHVSHALLIVMGCLALLSVLCGGAAVSFGAAPAFAPRASLLQTWVRHRMNSLNGPAGNGPTLHTGSAPAPATPGQFTTETFTDPSGQQMTYYLYVPQGYDPSKSYPLTLILHGTGERADTNHTADQNRQVLLKQTYVSAWNDSAVQAKWPSFVLVPQITGSVDRWVNVPGNKPVSELPARPSVSLQTAMDLLATITSNYTGVDPNRLYITGISMGGYGVWDAAERWPNIFAAAVPMSGDGVAAHANVLASLPIWDFHGAKDTDAPVSGAREMYAAITALGGLACYTEFPTQGHTLWVTENIYSNRVFQQWLFSQSRASTPGQRPAACKGLVIGGVPAR